MWKFIKLMYSPNYDYREIQQVPTVAEISSRMSDKAISYDLHHALRRKNHKKNVLYLFLQHNVRKIAVKNRKRYIY